MKKPPEKIDGATVLYWAWSQEKPFFYMTSEDLKVPIFGLAICRYAHSGSIYRFSCDADWETVNDSEWGAGEDAVADAMNTQSGQYDIESVNWQEF